MTQTQLQETPYSRRNGWSPQEEELLEKSLQEAKYNSLPLREVFEQAARFTGRKTNSVRNHYYACMRPQTDPDRVPFVPFGDEEIEDLLRYVLSAQAKGISVRKCTLVLGQGDRSAMLRYQNKYRSLLRTHPDLVKAVMYKMVQEDIPCYDPYNSNRLYMRYDRQTLEDIPAEVLTFADMVASNPYGSEIVRALTPVLKTTALSAREQLLTELCTEFLDLDAVEQTQQMPQFSANLRQILQKADADAL